MLQRDTLIRRLEYALDERNFAQKELTHVRDWMRAILAGQSADHVATVLARIEKALGNDA